MNTDRHMLLWRDYMKLASFALRLLDPDDLGHAVTAEVRDAAREVLGLPKVEDKNGMV